MDYLATRWFLVKDLDEDKIRTFHALERAAFEYAAAARDNFKTDKTVPPLWWQSAGAFLWARSGFYERCCREEYVKEIDFFAALVKNVLRGKGVNPVELFGDIKLMHECDLLVRTLPYTDPLTELSISSLPSSLPKVAA